MNDICKINITGRLIKDIEVFQTQSEYAVVSFTVANNYSEKVNNQWVEKANFFNCKAFCKGNQFDYYNNNLRKGLLVSIDGTIKTETWEKDGQKHSKIVVNCDKIIFDAGKQEQSNNQQPTKTYQSQQNGIPDPWADSAPGKSYKQQQNDDDIPF